MNNAVSQSLTHSCISSSIALLNLIFDSKLRVVSIQWAEPIVQADQAVSRSEWRLIVGAPALSLKQTPLINLKLIPFNLSIIV